MLGPIQVFLDGHPVALGAGSERALLALLALHAGRPVSTEAIIEALWDGAPPASAREMVRTYVARTRKRLGDAIHRQGGGYVLDIPPSALDATQFEQLCREGNKQISLGRAEDGAESLRRALTLWRDSPLPELEQSGSARAEIGRLEDLRLTAIEARAEVDLKQANPSALVPELERAVREYPYRERLRRALMLALYRSGRQTEALECYLEGRRRLVDEIGIEPGRELQALQQAILKHDPALDFPVSPPPRAQSQSDVSPQAQNPRKHRRAAGVAAVIGVIGAAILVAVLFSQSSPALQLGRETLAQLDPATARVLQAHRIAGVPGPIAVGTRTAWVGDGQNRSVVTVDSDTLRTVALTRLGVFPYQIATDGAEAWAGDGFYGTITAIDGRGAKTRTFRPEPRSTGRLALAAGTGVLWVGSQDGTLSELEPRAGRPVAVIQGVGDAQALALAAGSVWIAEANEDSLREVDTNTHRVTRSIPIGGAPSGITLGDGSIWAVTPEESRVWRVNPHTGAVIAAITVAPQSELITATRNDVWVGSSAGTLQEIDPTQDAVTRTLQLPGPIGGMAAGQARLWISVR